MERPSPTPDGNRRANRDPGLAPLAHATGGWPVPPVGPPMSLGLPQPHPDQVLCQPLGRARVRAHQHLSQRTELPPSGLAADACSAFPGGFVTDVGLARGSKAGRPWSTKAILRPGGPPCRAISGLQRAAALITNRTPSVSEAPGGPLPLRPPVPRGSTVGDGPPAAHGALRPMPHYPSLRALVAFPQGASLGRGARYPGSQGDPLATDGHRGAGARHFSTGRDARPLPPNPLSSGGGERPARCSSFRRIHASGLPGPRAAPPEQCTVRDQATWLFGVQRGLGALPYSTDSA